MLGLGDTNVFLAYILTVLSAVLCVVYGIVNWNKGAGPTREEIKEEKEWAEEEKQIESML